MGKIKQFAMRISEEMGMDGQLTDGVLREAGEQMKLESIKAQIKQAHASHMCEACERNVATHDFLCADCHESMHTAYGDPVEYTADELDEMEREHYARREMETGYKHHNGPEGLE